MTLLGHGAARLRPIGLRRNRRSASHGMGDRLQLESVIDFSRNLQGVAVVSTSDRLGSMNATRVSGRGPDLLGQSIVLADTKTARPSLPVFVRNSTVVPVLNAFGLFARAARDR